VKLNPVEPHYSDYLCDESLLKGAAEQIVFPQNTVDVIEILKQHQKVTLQGGRTGITGGSVPNGGIILNTSKMNEMGEIKEGLVDVQPGVLLQNVREVLAQTDWFFPPDPTETTASIGGMIANNASGARSFSFGSIRNWIQKIEVVLANGDVLQLERGVDQAKECLVKLGEFEGKLPLIKPRSTKNAAGYFVRPNMDLLDLFIGAEGTLGVVTQATLKLEKKPSNIGAFLTFFESESKAVEWVRWLKKNQTPLSIEFFDAASLALLSRSSISELVPPNQAQSAIFFECKEDLPASVFEEIEEQSIDCWFAETLAEKERLRLFRHALPEAVNQMIAQRKKREPALTKLGTDMAVCEGQLEKILALYHSDLKKADLEYVIFGHIGDNHLHVNIIPRDLNDYKRGKKLYLAWAKQVVAWGGTVSAEHGIGKLKTDLLKLMYSPAEYQGMQTLKKQLDPDNKLNPGNLF